MLKSVNGLIITIIKCDPMIAENIQYFRAEMGGEVRFNCPDTGKIFRKAKLISEGFSYNEMEATRIAVQWFILGKVDIKNEFFIGDFNCEPDNDNVHYIDVQLSEPFKSTLEKLFDISVWKIPKETVNA